MSMRKKALSMKDLYVYAMDFFNEECQTYNYDERKKEVELVMKYLDYVWKNRKEKGPSFAYRFTDKKL